MAPHDFITREGAELMFMQMLDEYEREKVEPRDKRNRDSIGEVKDLVQQGKGMIKLASFICGSAGLLWIGLQIYHAMKA